MSNKIFVVFNERRKTTRYKMSYEKKGRKYKIISTVKISFEDAMEIDRIIRHALDFEYGWGGTEIARKIVKKLQPRHPEILASNVKGDTKGKRWIIELGGSPSEFSKP